MGRSVAALYIKIYMHDAYVNYCTALMMRGSDLGVDFYRESLR